MKRALLIVAAMVITLVFTAGAWAEEPLANRLDRLEAKVATLQSQVSHLQGQVNTYESILRFLAVDTNVINGLKGPHLIFHHVNVHIQSGSGKTDDGGTPRGLGNLIIGYNELAGGMPPAPANFRTGAHNLVIGPDHKYSSWGGFVAGHNNSISGAYSSVSGGWSNVASGQFSSVSGGYANKANGQSSTVSGGEHNTAAGQYSSILGGGNCAATAQGSTVSGGFRNFANGIGSSVSGGMDNKATGPQSSVSGGGNNNAIGQMSSILGGSGKTAAAQYQTVP